MNVVFRLHHLLGDKLTALSLYVGMAAKPGSGLRVCCEAGGAACCEGHDAGRVVS